MEEKLITVAELTLMKERRDALAESHAELMAKLMNKALSYHSINHISEAAAPSFDNCNLYPCVYDSTLLAKARAAKKA